MPINLVQWERWVFHITHIDNLAAIVANGLYCKNEADRRRIVYRSIADQGIQARRSATPIPLGGRGTLHDYVPFYFGARSPMLFAVKGYCSQDDICYLAAPWSVLDLPTTVLTDGHAAASGTQYFCGIEHLSKVDQAAAGAIWWSDPQELRRKKSAEVLVYEHVPTDSLPWIVVRCEETAEKAREIVSLQGVEIKVRVAPEYYYR